jgi:phage-related protein
MVVSIHGTSWNPAKEWDAETVDEIADVLDDFGQRTSCQWTWPQNWRGRQ